MVNLGARILSAKIYEIKSVNNEGTDIEMTRISSPPPQANTIVLHLIIL